MGNTFDAVVIGGGIVGAAVAERLVRSGRRVALVERGEVGREASYAAAGLLTPVHPWNYPDAMLRLDDESFGMWPALAERLRSATGVDVELRRTGLLSLIESDDDEREAGRRVEWKRARGERVERLDAAAVREAEPIVGPEILGALLLPDLAQVRNHRVAPALALAAAGSGATILERTSALEILEAGGRTTGVRTTAGLLSTGAVVLAAGAWSGQLLADGRRPPALETVPARGQMLLLRREPGALRHMVLAGGDYLVPRSDGRILAGSTVEYAGFDTRVTLGGLRSMAAAVGRYAPELALAPVEGSWAGLRPDTPDHLPVIGEVRPGLVAATGHFRSGIMLAPVTAEIVREVLDGESGRDLSAFAPHRDAPRRAGS